MECYSDHLQSPLEYFPIPVIACKPSPEIVLPISYESYDISNINKMSEAESY